MAGSEGRRTGDRTCFVISPTREAPQSAGQSSGHAGFRRRFHAMSCDAAMTQTCHHRPNSATAPRFAVLSCMVRAPQSVGQLSGHAGFRRCFHAMSCDATMTQACHHRPNFSNCPRLCGALLEGDPAALTSPCPRSKQTRQRRSFSARTIRTHDLPMYGGNRASDDPQTKQTASCNPPESHKQVEKWKRAPTNL